jgi:S-layer protein
LSIDGSTGGTVSGVSTAQALTVNATNAGGTSTITFANASGAADSYAITFNASTTGTTATPTTIDAGIVGIEGIESVTVHSGSAAGVNANAIALKDAAATSLTLDGSQALTVTFNTAFGTSSATTGVTTIDGHTATGALSIDETNVKAASAGLTVIGGSAADTITTNAFASTLTGNGGADTFKVGLTVTGSATAPVYTTITDASTTDVISFANTASAGTDAGFTTTKVNVGAATDLVSALNIATNASASTAGNSAENWFQYGSNTYVVDHLGAAGSLGTGDVVVKLAGLIDLSTATYSAHTLTLA